MKTRSEVARMGGKARFKALSRERRREIASLGAVAVNRARTKKQRSEAARNAVVARWKKKRGFERALKRRAA